MNKSRRKRIANIVENLSQLEGLKDITQYCNILDAVDDPLQDIIDEEQEALDNLPESFMFSQRYDDMYDAVSDMEGAQTDLAIASERITTRGKFHASDKKMVREAIATLNRLSQ